MLKVPAWLRPVVYSATSLMNGLILGFFSKKEWTDIYKIKSLPRIHSPIAVVLLPIVLIFNIALMVTATIEIINNGITLKTITALLVEVAKIIQTLLALLSIAAIVSISAVVVSALLVTVISLEALFNVGCFFSHLRSYYSAGTPQEQHENKMLLTKYASNFFVSALLAVGAGFTLLSTIAAPILFPIGIVTALIASIGGIMVVSLGYYAEKKAQEPQPVLPHLLAPILRPLLENADNEADVEHIDALDLSADGSGMSENMLHDEPQYSSNPSRMFYRIKTNTSMNNTNNLKMKK